MTSNELKQNIIDAGRRAVEQLIKVAKEEIIKPDPEDELAADRLKNAAATKKLAIFDAFEILNRIESEKEALELSSKGSDNRKTKQGFAERRSK
jgi:secreted protein with Ig-like and vWFA domain